MRDVESLLALTADAPPARSWWRHRKGGLYVVIGAAIEESALTPVVIYRASDSHLVWTRPLAEFLDGRFTRTPPPVPNGNTPKE